MSLNINIFLEQMQRFLLHLASNTTDIYQSLCSQQNSECKVKSFRECNSTDEKYCIQSFPKQKRCIFKGNRVSKSSGIKLPNDFNISSMTNQQKLFICASTKLDTIFKQIKQKLTGKINRIYIGTSWGFFRVFPGILQKNKNGECLKNYNPTQRVWYLQATTGSKEVIFIIDLSSQMTQDMLQKTKQAVISSIQVLGILDFFGVIILNEWTELLIYKHLNRATEAMKLAMTNSIRQLVIDKDAKNVSLIDAFQMAKELFDNLHINQPQNNDYGPHCLHSTKIIHLLKANQPASQDLDQIFTTLKLLNSNYSTKIFTYRLNRDLNTKIQQSLLKKIAQNNSGIFYYQEKSIQKQLKKKIRQYEKLISKSINIDQAIISEPTNDAITGERVAIMSIPIYGYMEDTRLIQAAAGVNILMSELENNTMTQKQVIKQLMKCFPKEPIKFDSCYLQKLRQQQNDLQQTSHKPSQKRCHYLIKLTQSCPYQVEGQIFSNFGQSRQSIYSSGDKYISINQNECCDIGVFNLILLIGGGLAFFLVILLIGLFIKKLYGSTTQQRHIGYITRQNASSVTHSGTIQRISE